MLGLAHVSKNQQPETSNRGAEEEEKHQERVRSQKKSFHESFKTRMELSSQNSSIGKLSERIKS